VYDCAKYSFPLTDHARNCVPLTETVLACGPTVIPTESPDTGSEADDDDDDTDSQSFVSRVPVKRPRQGGCIRARLGRGGRVAFDRTSLEEWISEHPLPDAPIVSSAVLADDPTAMIDDKKQL